MSTDTDTRTAALDLQDAWDQVSSNAMRGLTPAGWEPMQKAVAVVSDALLQGNPTSVTREQVRAASHAADLAGIPGPGAEDKWHTDFLTALGVQVVG